VRSLAEHIHRLEFNSMTEVAIAVAYWRRIAGPEARAARERPPLRVSAARSTESRLMPVAFTSRLIHQ